MKLVRYGPPGKEKPGLIDADGKLRDLSRKVKDIDAQALAPAKLKELAKLDAKKLPLVKGRPRLGPCVATPSKFVAIGLNFTDHAKETGSPIPEYPVVFYKAPELHRRRERQRDAPQGLDAGRLGSRARLSSSAAPPATSPSATRSSTSPAIASSTTYRSAISSSRRARASGARARAATRSGRWDPGS